MEREFPSESENKVKSKAAKYKYNIGLDDAVRRNEVVEFVPLNSEKKKKEQLSNKIPLLSVGNQQIGKTLPSKGFRGSSSIRSTSFEKC